MALIDSVYVFEVVYPRVSSISAILASIVVLSMIFISIYDFQLVNRVSLRLQTMISVLDIYVHTTPLWYKYYAVESPMCTFIAFLRFFVPLLFMFYNVAIVVNLHLLFLTDYKVGKRMEIIYWIVPLLMSLAIVIPLLAVGALGYGEYDRCLLKDQNEHVYLMADIFGNLLWNFLSFVYMVIVVIAISIKLRKDIEMIKISKRFTTVKDVNKAIKKATLFINKILLYPSVAIISYSGMLVSQIYLHANKEGNPDLDNWALIGAGLSGTFNFIAFMCDPTFHSAIYFIYKRHFRRSTNMNESSTDVHGTYPLTSSTDESYSQKYSAETEHGIVSPRIEKDGYSSQVKYL